jgi:predicted nuclease of restriction endonuclease-like (RecB) superfamily
VLKNLSIQLTQEFGKGYDESNLRNIRQFFKSFPIRDALLHELSWTHYRILSRVLEVAKRMYYLEECIASHWDSRLLERQINTLTYERVVAIPQRDEVPHINHFLKDPLIFEFTGLSADTKHSERKIETALLDHLQSFLMELGKGFAFVARQKHINTDTKDFFIDLVFYNYILKCFVIINLKTDELSHQDIGQLDMYVRMYDDLYRSESVNPTIGILLCTEKDDAIVKYSVMSDKNNLFASKYLHYLPKEEELKALINEDTMRRRMYERDKAL